MYVPSSFAEHDLPTLQGFIEQYSFGMLVSQQGAVPFVTHLPFLVDRTCGARGSLLTHLAKANPHWKSLRGQEALAVFSGPHAYLSPTWYEAEGTVPTWNYTAVHCYGTVRLIEDPLELSLLVTRMVDHYEQGLPTPWQLPPREDSVERMLSQIVGVELEITRIEGKFKLSQNHPVARRELVIKALREQKDANSVQTAEWMQWALGRAGPKNSGGIW